VKVFPCGGIFLECPDARDSEHNVGRRLSTNHRTSLFLTV
jgi:hypothetical protein